MAFFKYEIQYFVQWEFGLDAGLKDIEDGYKDNYWAILPVERLSISEDLFSDEQAQNSNFERAEVKAEKAVQKHGMNIKGKEKNPQIDDAYILLGKARYYSGRFIPALEAFNYILFKYPEAVILIWPKYGALKQICASKMKLQL